MEVFNLQELYSNSKTPWQMIVSKRRAFIFKGVFTVVKNDFFYLHGLSDWNRPIMLYYITREIFLN